jgi:hypothetical protein
MTNEKTLAIPTIHLNGSSKKELIDDLKDATYSLRVSKIKLSKTMPNARDFYVQKDPYAYQIAQEQHEDRLNRLESVYEELQAILNAIS